jgi:bifunctional oligoribonuclease and PAP phosphatase NrnA
MLDQVLNEIRTRKRFVLTSHARPDGDAVGSTLACSEILRAMGKQTDVVLRDGVPRVYQSLPFAAQVIHAGGVNGSYDAAIILECDNIQRTRLQGLEGQFLINIDHHRSGRSFGHVNWIDPKAVATAELIYKLAKAADVTISPEVATCLYTAVLTDTGAFMFEGTSEHTFELARELVLAGADPV